MKRLIVGCGYLGRRVADRWQRAGDTVHVVTRSREHGTAFAQAGMFPLVADVLLPETLRDLPKVDTVLFAVGYDRSSLASIYQVYVEGLRNVLDAIQNDPAQFLYISSTGVYAEQRGGWVNEDSPTHGGREGTKACLDAENILQTHPLGVDGKILRCAGIYGPDRLPRRDALLKEQPLPAPADGYLNLIHVDDAAQAVEAAAVRGNAGIYSIADGAPVLRRDYLIELARLLNAPPPKFVEVLGNTQGRSATSKRVHNDRMRNELGVRLHYPSYRAGLAAIVRGDNR